MQRIKLLHEEWLFDPNQLLGPVGGFGMVYRGKRVNSDESVAVKKLKISAEDFAHRELRIAETFKDKNYQNVMAVLDSGQDADSDAYYVVMPRAEKSLQDILNNRMLSENETLGILMQIASGLSEVPELVHRDLKPGNVLYHNGNWKIADFGIARFVEESTSLQTLKDCLSPLYAAPEQCNFERATNATDVYALGCIGFALINGTPPFSGNNFEEIKQEHLFSSPPKLPDQTNPRLRSLLLMMLRKTPETRPSINRVRIQILRIIEYQQETQSRAGIEAFGKVGAEALERFAEEEARKKLVASKHENRRLILDNAVDILEEVIDLLEKNIREYAPVAIISRSDQNKIDVQLEGARLEMTRINGLYEEEDFHKSGWDVISGAVIIVHQKKQRKYQWGASLWYTDLGENGNHRWYEISYFLSNLKQAYAPFPIDDPKAADLAVSPTMSQYQVAYGPIPVDDENVEEFCDRWLGLLAKAYQGQLEFPRKLPLPKIPQ